MAKKTSVKTKTAAKKVVNKPVVPVVVLVIRGIAGKLNDVPNLPGDLSDARGKVMASIDRLANRVAKNIAGAGKKAERNAAKVVRAEAKTKRNTERRDKKVAAHKALLAKAAVLQAEIDSNSTS